MENQWYIVCSAPSMTEKPLQLLFGVISNYAAEVH